MTYTEEGNTVRLEMTRDDYCNLLCYLGIAIGASLDHAGRGVAINLLEFVNALNRTNPRFEQYEVPRKSGQGAKSDIGTAEPSPISPV